MSRCFCIRKSLWRLWKRVGPTLIVLLLLPSLTSCGGNQTGTPESAEQHELAKYQELVRSDPNNLQYRSALANLLLQTRAYPEAIEQYRKVLEAQKDDIGALIGLGMAYKEQGDRANARQYFNQAVEVAGKSEYARLDRRLELVHYYLGTMWWDEQRWAQAEEEFNKALEISRTNSDIYYQLGLAQQKQDKLDQAIESYTRALAMTPNFVEAYQAMSEVYSWQGKQGEELYAQGMAALFQGDNNKAIRQLKAATEKAPQLANAWWGLGYAFEKKGDAAGAREYYAQALSVEPRHALAMQSMTRLKGAER